MAYYPDVIINFDLSGFIQFLQIGTLRHYIDDTILVVGLCILVGYIIQMYFVRQGASIITIKRDFLLLLRLVSRLIGLALLLRLIVFFAADSGVGFVDFYWHGVLLSSGESLGVAALRNDALTQFLCFYITLLFWYFVELCGFFFRRYAIGYRYFREMPLMLLFMLLGLRLLLQSDDIVVFLIALELVTYVAITFIAVQFGRMGGAGRAGIEAAVKYFVFSSLATLLFLLAAAQLYFVTATTNVSQFAAFCLTYPQQLLIFGDVLLFGVVVFFVAFFFKLGAVPFHFWLPDVYDGSDLIAAVLLMVFVSPALTLKFIIFSYSLCGALVNVPLLSEFFLACGLLSLLLGTLGAFIQTRIKRFLAYTSIGHLGFILVALSCVSALAYAAAIFYVLLYSLMLLVVFSVLIVHRAAVGGHFGLRVFGYFTEFRFLYASGGWFLVMVFGIVFFSFAGVPPFGGFFMKFFVLVALVSAANFWVALLVVGVAVVNSYLYLRILRVAFLETQESALNAYFPVASVDFYRIGLQLAQPVSATVVSGRAVWFLGFASGFLVFFSVVISYFFDGSSSALVYFVSSL
jgi:NADH-quinone oxidoreductase subunit N